MSKDATIEQMIEAAYREHPWLGVGPVEEVIQATKEYRRNLSAVDQKLFDEQIRLGRYPSAVIETVEIAAGRDRPQGSPVSATQEPVEVK